MKCTGCGFINFDHLSKCRKCDEDLSAVRKGLGLADFRPNPPFFLKALLEESQQAAAEIGPGAAIPAPGVPAVARISTEALELPPDEARGVNPGAVPWKMEEPGKRAAVGPRTVQEAGAASVTDEGAIPQYYIDDAELDELTENLSIIQSPENGFDVRQNAPPPFPDGLPQVADPSNLELESNISLASTSEAEELQFRKGKQEMGLGSAIPRLLPEALKGKAKD
jgi:hypothetical protein